MHFDFLGDLVIVFAIGGVVIFALRGLRLPAIVGLLVAGAAVGPHGLSLIGDVKHVEVLAEIGVVLLLFTVGLEFSLTQLARMWRVIVIAGGGQLAACIAAVALATAWRGEGLGTPIFFGFLAVMSSTAIVLRLLGERAELGAPHGRIVLGVLLFQDLSIVPLMLLVPFLAGTGAGIGALALTLGKACLVVAGVVFAARKIVPPILLRVVRARSREVFLTMLLVLCLGTAYLTSLAGLSLALGAFLGGLAIGESEYSHQAMAEAVPFRDAFGMLFFVSIGMLMDVRFALAELPVVVLVVFGIVLLKTLTAALPVMLLGYPAPVALHSGLALAQIGEFAFVLSRSGLELGLVGAYDYQIFLSASVLTMVLTPALLGAGRALSQRMPDRVRIVPWRAGKHEHAESQIPLNDHVIIAGYGVNGQNVSRALRASGIAYVVLEMNPETVDAARARDEPIHYGDCTRLPVLREAGIDRARMFVVAISDAASTRQAVSIARTENPKLHVLVRTRFVSEVDELRTLGADEVIPEEFETSIEIFARVLERYEVPRNRVLELVDQVRGGAYQMLRGAVRPGKDQLAHAALRDVNVDTLLVRAEAEAVGRSLVQLDLRARFGLTVLAVQRAEQSHANPAPDFVLQADDVLVVMGEPKALDRALVLVDPPAKRQS